MGNQMRSGLAMPRTNPMAASSCLSDLWGQKGQKIKGPHLHCGSTYTVLVPRLTTSCCPLALPRL